MPFDEDTEARIARAMALEEARLRHDAYLSGNWQVNGHLLYIDARRIQRAWRRKWGLISRGRSVNPIQRVARGFLGRRKAKKQKKHLLEVQQEELLRRCRPRLVSSAPATFSRGSLRLEHNPFRRRPYSREHYPRVPESSMFHELRTYFDAEYRLHMVRLELRKLLASTKTSLSDLFDKVDEDRSMVINRDELKRMIEIAGCHVKDMEIDYLMGKIDRDCSGEIDLSELTAWFNSKEDEKLTCRRTRFDDDFNDVRILKRESLRLHPETQTLMNELWEMTDLDGSGSISMQEYIILHVQLQSYMLPKGEFRDTNTARRLAMAEWEFDRRGADYMNKNLFYIAMFQLVDLWRESGKINNDTFFEAIDTMHRQTTYINPDGSRRWRWINEDGTGNHSVQRLKEEMLMEAMLDRINTQLLHEHKPPPPPPQVANSPVNGLLNEISAGNSVTPIVEMSAAEKEWRSLEARAEETAEDLERQLAQEQLDWEIEEKEARQMRERARQEDAERRRALVEAAEKEYESMKWDGTLAKFKLNGPIKGSLRDFAIAVADSSLDVFQVRTVIISCIGILHKYLNLCLSGCW